MECHGGLFEWIGRWRGAVQFLDVPLGSERSSLPARGLSVFV